MLSRLRPARLTSMLLLRKALLCMLRPSDIPSVWMRQCKANRTGHSRFRENDPLPGDDTSNGPFGLLKKKQAKPSGRHTGSGIRNNPWTGQTSPPQNIPAADGAHITPKTTLPTSHVTGETHSPGPLRTTPSMHRKSFTSPGMSLYPSSTQGYERKIIKRSKRKKPKE